MTALSELSEALGQTIAKAERSVVTLHPDRCSLTSGIAWSNDVVIAAAHAFRREEGLQATISGKRVTATLIGLDMSSDLAAVRVEAQLEPLTAPEAHEVRTGELVVGLSASPHGVRARLGMLSCAGGEWRLPGGARLERYLESDLAPAPGVSGGPLLRASGEWIGVNTAGLLRGQLLALPVASVRGIMACLLAHGRVRRAQLGVGVQPVELQPAGARVPRPALMVLSLKQSSAAAEAGVLQGDVLLALGGTRLERVEDLQGVLADDQAARRVSLELVRAGAPLTLPVLLPARPGP